jgi:succinate dehydrogenase flavin-adding protein (antitoxin of CptAB toxin-antitoxin module)
MFVQGVRRLSILPLSHATNRGRSAVMKIMPRCYNTGIDPLDGGDQDIRDLPGLTPEQKIKIRDADTNFRNRHFSIEAAMDDAERDLVRRKRMIYRSKQRGWLEADLLMGSWAVENVPKLSEAELDEYDILLKEETIDIYNYISGKDALPPHLAELGVMKKIQGYAMERTMASPEFYRTVKVHTNLT